MSQSISQSSVALVRSSRASGAAVAALFSEGSDVPMVARRAHIARPRRIGALAKSALTGVRLALLSRTPRKPIAFPAFEAYALRRSTQT